MGAVPTTIKTTAMDVVRVAEGPMTVMCINPDSNSNPVYMQTNGKIATTVDTDSEEVNPGNFGIAFLDAGDRLSMIAATAATGVILKFFRAKTTLVAEIYALAVTASLMVANLFWQNVAGKLQMRAPFTTWIARSGTDAIIQNDQGNSGLIVANGANGDASLTADGTGNAVLASGDGTDYVAMGTARLNITRASQQKVDLTDTEFIHQNISTTPVTFYNSSTGERHRFTETERMLRATGDGNINGVLDSVEYCVASGLTITAGDLVELSTTTGRVRGAQLNSTVCIGQAGTTGTGDAGGTVKVIVRVMGHLVAAFVADNAGVTQFQYALAGATDVNQLKSQAGNAGSFARVLNTAASGVSVDLFLHGPM